MSRFREALAGPGLGGIAEVKRRSPSAGDLRPRADASVLAALFERSGAAAVSILVDERFGGSVHDLRTARRATSLPLLAKGFFQGEEELEELQRAGADAVLLILRDLDDGVAARLMARARSLDMDPLVEAHDTEELGRAVTLGADPIGINARDLRTFQLDRRGQLELVTRAPKDRVLVAESGIENRAQAAALELAGADAVLVGSALMQAPEPGDRLAQMLSRPLVKVCGLTRDEDVAAAAEAGADLAGFVLAESPRQVAAPLPVPDTMLSVAVFVGLAGDIDSDLIQLYGEEDGHRGREARLTFRGRPVARVLDLPWRGEDPGHWAQARKAAARERVVLAGGLSPWNVRRAVEAVGPWAVDAARGLERGPGDKDPERMRAFLREARSAAFAEVAG